MEDGGNSPGANSRGNSVLCPYCGGGDVAGRVRLGQTGQVHLSVGLTYKAAAIFTGAEMLYADLCRNCGTVLRFFVKDPKRNWVQE